MCLRAERGGQTLRLTQMCEHNFQPSRAFGLRRFPQTQLHTFDERMRRLEPPACVAEVRLKQQHPSIKNQRTRLSEVGALFFGAPRLLTGGAA